MDTNAAACAAGTGVLGATEPPDPRRLVSALVPETPEPPEPAVSSRIDRHRPFVAEPADPATPIPGTIHDRPSVAPVLGIAHPAA